MYVRDGVDELRRCRLTFGGMFYGFSSTYRHKIMLINVLVRSWYKEERLILVSSDFTIVFIIHKTRTMVVLSLVEFHIRGYPISIHRRIIIKKSVSKGENNGSDLTLSC